MHSLSMAQNILQAALTEAEKHDGKRIEAISVQIGDPNFDELDSLQFCMQAAAEGTIAEGARMEIDLVGATARCSKCDCVFPVGDYPPICPSCGNRNLQMVADKELFSVSLE